MNQFLIIDVNSVVKIYILIIILDAIFDLTY